MSTDIKQNITANKYMENIKVRKMRFPVRIFD